MKKIEEIAEEMIRVRLSQILVNEEYKAGKFKIPIHLALGHEAMAVALNHAMREGDKLLLSHRNMAYNLARLQKLRPILDEYRLRPEGLIKGKLGSMNLINSQRGIIYSSSILGNNFSVAVGIAMADKIAGRNSVTFVLGGDGSIEEGSFYECLVMAKTLGVRMVFLIENNGWSLGTHIKERRCEIDIMSLCESVGIVFCNLFGNDVLRYEETLKNFRELVEGCEEPICIEVNVCTLGDRKTEDGRYINYHSGPAPTVGIEKLPDGILRESTEDPIFVISQKVGGENVLEISQKVMKELREELNNEIH